MVSKNLKLLEEKTSFILREIRNQFKKPCVLWSTGKDSTIMLYLIKKTFGKIPWPVIHIDTGYKFPGIYKFRDELAKKWNMNLIIVKNEKALKSGMGPKKGKLKCCSILKTEALKDYIKALGIDHEAVAGPGLGTIILNYKYKSSSVKERALYLNEQLQLPEEERILSIKELDAGQVMHKPGKL